MPWYLMYTYDPQTPDSKPSYKFVPMEVDIPDDYLDLPAIDEIRRVARNVWVGVQSGVDNCGLGMNGLSDPEIIWRDNLTKVEVEDANKYLHDFIKAQEL